jgi:hypothetical protein
MKILITAFISVLFLGSCKKEVTELPPATQTGANTFGAMVDGKMWVPQRFGSIPSNNLLEARLLGNNLYIVAQNFSSSPTETEFDITVYGVTGPATYSLSPAAGIGYYVKRNLSPINEWTTSATFTGSVTITKLDTVSRIVSGTFQFNAVEVFNSAPPISVVDGRFDIKY